MRPSHLIFGTWALAGVVAGVVVAAVVLLRWIPFEKSGRGASLVEVLYFLGCVIPFGAMAIHSSQIGLNYGSTSLSDPKAVYMRRVRQAWLHVVPISGSLAILVPSMLTICSFAIYGGKAMPICFGSFFYALPAVYFLRFLPRAGSLISDWAAEEEA